MNPSLDTAPAPADRVFDVRTLSDEEAHAFGVRVALMARDLGATRTRLAGTEKRLAEVLADNEALRLRVRGQTDTITRLQAADVADPRPLLDRIEQALTAPCPASVRPELLGSYAPVEVEDAAAEEDEGDDDDLDDEDCGAACTCWACAPPKPSTMVGPAPAPRWFGRLRWRR